MNENASLKIMLNLFKKVEQPYRVGKKKIEGSFIVRNFRRKGEFVTCFSEDAVMSLVPISGSWKSFENDEKCFFFHFKSSFRSQDI